MADELQLLVGLLLAGGLVLTTLAILTWNRRTTHTGMALTILLLGAAVWVFGAAAEHLYISLEGKIFASRIQYIGVAMLPLSALATVLHAIGKRAWLDRFLPLLILLSISVVTLVFTNDYHHLVWKELSLTQNPSLPLMKISYGPGFWLIQLVAQCQLIAAALLFLPRCLKRWGGEATFAYIGFAGPWIANIVYVTRSGPWPELDLTPLGLVVMGVGFTISFHSYGSVFSTVKIAERSVLDHLSDPIFIVDHHQRLLSANQAAAQWLKLPALPADIDEALADFPDLLESLVAAGGQDEITVKLEAEGVSNNFALQRHSIAVRKRRPQGSIIVLKNVTAQLERQALLEKAASTDALTELSNRRHFHLMLERALTNAQHGDHAIALLFLDLDRFKLVNDLHGHLAGDELLRQVAGRLMHSIRQNDRVARPDEYEEITVSRLGGDEFMIMLTRLSTPEDAALVARRLNEEMSRPFELDNTQATIGVSIGIAMFPQDGTSADELIFNCDHALASAKQSGRGRYEFFSQEMSDRARRRDDIELRMKHALDNNEMQLHYQPIRSINDRSIVSTEVLLRWKNSQLGTVCPDEFIPIAEETGFIVELGLWVLDSVCAQMTAWRADGYQLPSIAVNISARQLLDSSFSSDVENLLKKWDIEGTSFEFEVTESSILSKNPTTDGALHGLAKMGIALALDDFGTGYASLSQLRRFQFDHLKIDKSFISDIGNKPEDEQLVKAIISLAKDLDIETIAEGVETPAQLDFLLRESCDRVQGYLFGKPAPADEYIGLLTKPSRRL